MADQIFNRCGAVPGILDAIIVQGDASAASENLAKAKARRGEVKVMGGDGQGVAVAVKACCKGVLV